LREICTMGSERGDEYKRPCSLGEGTGSKEPDYSEAPQWATASRLVPTHQADFCPNSYGFRPRRSPHHALAQVRRSVLRRMFTVIDVDLSRYFDTVRHPILLDKIAKRVQDPEVMHLVKQILKAAGKIGVPQGGPFSPPAANIYLTEIDWMFEAIRRKTAQGPYEAVNYHRFADDLVITVSGHHTKRAGRNAPYNDSKNNSPRSG
jgi:retron-type reverse transcriptase